MCCTLSLQYIYNVYEHNLFYITCRSKTKGWPPCYPLHTSNLLVLTLGYIYTVIVYMKYKIRAYCTAKKGGKNSMHVDYYLAFVVKLLLQVITGSEA